MLQSVCARYFKTMLFAVDICRLHVNMGSVVTSCHVNESNDAN